MSASFDPNHPLPDAYWAITDRLIAGPYPGTRKEHVVHERVLRTLGLCERLARCIQWDLPNKLGHIDGTPSS